MAAEKTSEAISIQPILSDEQKEQFVRDGYTVVRGLIPPDVVQKTREDLLQSLGADLTDESTWRRGKETTDWAWGAGYLTEACRSERVEQVVAELAGPNFLRGISYHTGKNSVGRESEEHGYIPVLTFPLASRAQQEKRFVEPQGWHVDGIAGTDILPTVFMMVMLVYLTDVSSHGGATTVKPGSHRQLYEHWVQNGMTPIWELNNQYAPSLPIPGKAGDVIFFHYLLVHSGSDNFDDHIRVGLNTAVHQDPEHPFQHKTGAPDESWTPFDYTVRVDNISGARTLVPAPAPVIV